MVAIRAFTRWTTLLAMLPAVLLGTATWAHAQPLDGSKRITPPVVGPQITLSTAQTLAIAAKRAAVLSGAQRAPATPSPSEKPVGPQPNPAIPLAPEPVLARAPGLAKPISWPAVSPSLGRVPRSSWTEP